MPMEYEKLIESQRTFFDSGQSKDPGYRVEQLKKVLRLLRENEDTLYRAIYKDFGKSAYETYLTEFALIYHDLKLYIRQTKRWSRRKRVRTNLANLPGSSYIYPEPLGLALIIGTWNYPYQLTLLPAVAALAAGNCVIVKPSEIAPESSAAIARLINSNFDPGYFHVAEGGRETSIALLEHRFDKIFFTGSSAVGRIIYEAAARHLTPVTLELGGKSPTIVLADADLKVAARRIVWAKFLNAGQTCVAPDFLLVERPAEQALLEAIGKEMERYKAEVDKEWGNYLRIVNTRHFERLRALIDRDKVCFGGQTDVAERIIRPTVLKNIGFDHPLMQEEIFGPLLPVLAFDDLDTVLDQLKKMPKPLSCYVYGRNHQRIEKILRSISFGSGAVNDSVMQFANSHLPFGGVGSSGMGKYHGYAGFATFSHFKSILRKPFRLEPLIKYPPYREWKMKIMRLLLE